MRTSCVAVAGIATLALVAATAGIVVAEQESDADAAPVGVVIDVAFQADLDHGQVASEPGGAFHTIYEQITTERWEASDPRLSGDATRHMTRHEYPNLGYFLAGFEYSLANEGGSWVGTCTRIGSHQPIYAMEFGGAMNMALDGAGGYEGLTAYLTSACAADCGDDNHWTNRGLIVADGTPPFPEPAG